MELDIRVDEATISDQSDSRDAIVARQVSLRVSCPRSVEGSADPGSRSVLFRRGSRGRKESRVNVYLEDGIR